MKEKGFTLIELLAVIVILAIIALIATPIVLNIINDSKESATLRSADFYLDAVEFSIAERVLESKSIANGIYPVMESGNVCLGKLDNNTCSDEMVVEVNGEVPTTGTITITDGGAKITKVDGTAVTVLIDKEGYANLKSRMLYKSEVADSNGTNEYLYENLFREKWEGSGTQPTNNIDGIWGYWTLSSVADYSTGAWRVHYYGLVGLCNVSYDSYYGVRPVITLKI